jgi:NADH-quinone oxidoreductase subunit N
MQLNMFTALIILVFAAAISYRSYKLSFLLSLSSIVIMVSGGLNTYAILIFSIALLNLLSLLVIRNNQMVGVDYAMVAIIAVATIYVFFTTDLAILLTLFVIASVPTYLLIMASEIGDRPNVDVGIKYITFMVIATVLFIIGASTLQISSEPLLYSIGALLLIIGLAMEVGVAPVHEWVPDVFASADPIPVSIVASIAKFVPFIVAYKILLATSNPLTPQILLVVALIAAVSMFIGNIGALTTTDMSRVLAYSTVANMGYILATFAALTASSELVYFAVAGGLLQLAVNSFGKVGFFSAIKSDGTSPIPAYLLSFSFIGLPPLMGFWSKLFIIYSLVFSDYIWLAVILVINSAISVPYYIRLARVLGVKWRFNLANTVTLFAALAMLITIIPPTWFVDVISIMEGM